MYFEQISLPLVSVSLNSNINAHSYQKTVETNPNLEAINTEQA